jgi:hypothetical protein
MGAEAMRDVVKDKVQAYFSEKLGLVTSFSEYTASCVLEELNGRFLKDQDLAAGLVVCRAEVIRYLDSIRSCSPPPLVTGEDIAFMEAEAIENATKYFGGGSQEYKTNLIKMLSESKSNWEMRLKDKGEVRTNPFAVLGELYDAGRI